jgi:glycosyltransferase involved in cell wall biosynthesis
MEKVSLYIPCYNAERYIKKCLDSVINQTYKIDEIMVIDDGSTDKTVAIAKNYPVRIISFKENRGLAACRNIAFKEATNEFVAALDADCVASPGWLAELMKCFVDDDIAGVGGILVERHTLSVADEWRSVHMAQQWGHELLEDPPFLYGNNTVFRKDCVQKASFYNEVFRNNYEDVDLSMRIYDNELNLVYNPKARVEHLKKDTTRSVLETHWRWQYYSHMNRMRCNKGLRKIALKIGCISGYTGGIFREDLLDKNYN